MMALAALPNGVAMPLADIPRLGVDRFRAAVLAEVQGGARLSALFACPDGAEALLLVAVLARDDRGVLAVTTCSVEDEYPAITPACPQAQGFEREIAELWGVRPLGHPWLKPLRFQPPRRASSGAAGASAQRPAIGLGPLFAMAGEEIHEVAVGPVHAGIIEPGHFRFQCHGETVYHLETSLGYQHRGVERALVGGPDARTIHYMETLAGDTTVGHATTYSRICEALSGTRVPARGQALRGVAQELERLANHIGDLGAMAGDVAFLPTSSYCGRIRGDVLNLTAILCGNRFGRGLVRPGGCGYDIAATNVAELLRRLDGLRRDTESAVELLFDSPTARARLDNTGALTPETCRELGLVGVAARACGVAVDVRHDYPYSIFRFVQIPVCTWHSGDVFGRTYVRWLEIQQSLTFVREQLAALPEGEVCREPAAAALAPDCLAVSLVEGWRGEICHVAVTDAAGHFACYKVVDPSFHNWFGLAIAMRNQQISDFPLCNKSFNLSYCGHDL
ncbi:MAG: NADH-quinone oxidoreductase subunit C [Thermoguttaceae bacterium]